VRITGFIFNRFFKDYYIFNLNYEKRKILSKFIICGQGLATYYVCVFIYNYSNRKEKNKLGRVKNLIPRHDKMREIF
jgi:hypothetical protein